MYEFWEQRYREEGYAYGEKPNAFFKQILDQLKPGKILLPAEGEGRNAIYAASKGWDVDAYDFSEQAIENAKDFASQHNVSINYSHSSHSDLDQYEQAYDAIGLIYAHVPNDIRQQFHHQLLALLKPGGSFIMEAFNTEQLGNASGGPVDIKMLYELDHVRSDFESECELEIIENVEESLAEGKYHVGKANFIRLLAIKK
ncbi:MAG: class I SAM-dependent methyltransferase [Gammaproteobacteria bacterium]|nr:class I SAM-dependent methyltransferase [Gammaproteobacteria bacterium]